MAGDGHESPPTAEKLGLQQRAIRTGLTALKTHDDMDILVFKVTLGKGRKKLLNHSHANGKLRDYKPTIKITRE